MLKKTNYQDVVQATLKVTRARQSMKVSFYYIDGLLIDSGPSRMQQAFIGFLSEHRVGQVFFTHHHEDHTGMGPWLEANTNSPLYIHESGMDVCREKAVLPLYRRVFWGARKPFHPQRAPETIETENHHFETFHTPGHAHDHLVLYNRENGWLFSGDLFLMTRPKSMFAFESVPQLIDSLKGTMKLDFDTMFCAHAGIIKNGKKAMKAKLDYLEEVQGKVMDLYEKGHSDREIKKILFPKLHPLNIISAFENSPYHLIRSITKEQRQKTIKNSGL